MNTPMMASATQVEDGDIQHDGGHDVVGFTAVDGVAGRTCWESIADERLIQLRLPEQAYVLTLRRG